MPSINDRAQAALANMEALLTEIAKAKVPPRDVPKEEKVALRTTRSKEFNIEVVDASNLTFPKDGPTKLVDFGDPVNLKFPIQDAEHANNARSRFKQFANQIYAKAKSKRVIHNRIVKRQLKFGATPSFDPKDPLDKLLDASVKDTLRKKNAKKALDDANDILKAIVDLRTSVADGHSHTANVNDETGDGTTGINNDHSHKILNWVVQEVDGHMHTVKRTSQKLHIGDPETATDQPSGQTTVTITSDVDLSEIKASTLKEMSIEQLKDTLNAVVNFFQVHFANNDDKKAEDLTRTQIVNAYVRIAKEFQRREMQIPVTSVGGSSTLPAVALEAIEKDPSIEDVIAKAVVDVSKPFAGFKDFAACVASQVKDGKTDEAARKICGALQRDFKEKTDKAEGTWDQIGKQIERIDVIAEAGRALREQLSDAVALGKQQLQELATPMVVVSDTDTQPGQQIAKLSLRPWTDTVRLVPFDQRISKRHTSAGTEIEERFVLGIVLEPEVIDAQEDIYNDDEIRKAAHGFMEHYGHIGLMHKDLIDGRVKILESYLSPCDFQVNGETVKKGTWLLGARIIDDALWDDVKEGRLTGWSIGGTAIREVDDQMNQLLAVLTP